MANPDTLSQPHAAAQAGLKEWHRIVEARDWDSLPDLLVSEVTFRNPATFAPYEGKDTMVAILRVVFSVMEDFTYHREFSSQTGYVLEFSAHVGGEQLLGVDVVEFNADGKITDFMVMMRPASIVAKLSEEAGKRMAASAAH